MAEENKNVEHQDEQTKDEVSSTQTTEQKTPKNDLREKLAIPLPDVDVEIKPTLKLANFAGDNSNVKIANFIRIFESLAKRSNWSEEEMKWNLVSYLEEDALDYYVEHVLANKEIDWKQAKKNTIDRFDQFQIEPFMEFLSFKWTPDMNLKQYFKKMRALGVASDLDEKKIIDGLTRGLPSHLRTELSHVTDLLQWSAVAHCLQQRLDDRNSFKHGNNGPWKGRGRGNRNRQNKPRSGHQQNEHLNASNTVGSHQTA